MQVPSWTGQPRARLIETIRATSEGEGKYIRQTGGSGNYGHVKLRLDPTPPGSGIVFANTAAAVIPAEYLAPIEQGVREAARGGILAGHEVTDFRATLFDGSFHEIDSNPMAFRIAASDAFHDAARKARPAVLEPVMNVVFTVPEATLGATIAEIGARRGRVASMNIVRGVAMVQALVPLEEMLRGRDPAPKAMVFDGFEPVPRGPDTADPAGSAVRNPWRPNPLSGSAAADPEIDWT
jgi:elongation factor G